MYYLVCHKKNVITVLIYPHYYALSIYKHAEPEYLCIKIACADTQIFKELFPRLGWEIQRTHY